MLNDILNKYFALKENHNKREYYDSYSKLVDLIYDLGDLGIFYSSGDSNIFVDKLDDIRDDLEEKAIRKWESE